MFGGSTRELNSLNNNYYNTIIVRRGAVNLTYIALTLSIENCRLPFYLESTYWARTMLTRRNFLCARRQSICYYGIIIVTKLRNLLCRLFSRSTTATAISNERWQLQFWTQNVIAISPILSTPFVIWQIRLMKDAMVSLIWVWNSEISTYPEKRDKYYPYKIYAYRW